LVAATIERPPERLAVDRYDLPVKGNAQRMDPRHETRLESIWVDQHEHTSEGIMRGNAIWQFEKRLEPRKLAAPIKSDIVPAFRTGDDGTHRNHQNVDKAMFHLASTARVFNAAQVVH
jgi:hypothetical protein